MNVFAVAMRTYHCHGASPLTPIPIRDRKCCGCTSGPDANRAYSIAPPTASRLFPRSNCGIARKKEITQPPALVAGSSLPSLAIRPRFYALCHTETVSFCTLLQVSSSDPRNPRDSLARASSSRPVSRPFPHRTAATKSQQIGNVCSIEQNSSLPPFTISYEWNPRHSPLGENL